MSTVKLESAQLGMNLGPDDKNVGVTHDVTLTMYRQKDAKNEIFWQTDQCLLLAIDSPYTQSNLYFPFDD